MPNMKKIKKRLAVLMIMMLTMSLLWGDAYFSLGSVSAAEDVSMGDTITSGDIETTPIEDFTYTINSGEVTITGYKGSDTNIVIPESINGCSVTSIGKSAFWRSSSLSSIEIPETVTSIGENAFYGCSNLSSIELPEGVTNINDYTFGECTNLSSVKISEGLFSIGNYAFVGCSSLSSINFPEGLLSIGDAAFHGCNSLTKVKLPQKLTNLGRFAFYECRNLSDIELSRGITSIAAATFFGCSSLNNVEISENILTIDSNAFYGCISLKDLYYEGSKEQWSRIAIDAAAGLEGVAIHYETQGDVDIPEQIVSPGDTEIESTDFTYTKGNGGILITGYSGYNTEIIIPARIDGYKVIGIGQSAFQGNTSLTSVTLSEGITNIESVAFEGCNLSIVKLPESITNVGLMAFGNNYELEIHYAGSKEQWKNINIFNTSGGLSGIGMIAFPNGTAIRIAKQSENDAHYTYGIYNGQDIYVTGYLGNGTEIILPSGVEAIAARAFYNCNHLTNVEIPEGIKGIEWSAFKGCSNLINIRIPESVTCIMEEAFWECSSLTDVYYAGSNAQWEDIKFGMNVGLDDVTIHFAKQSVISAKKVKLSQTKLSINKGKTVILKATITPSNSTDTIKWSSSNSKVAKVSDKGVITAVKKGSATITAKTTSGKTATCKVTVKEIKSTKIKLNKTKVTINKGKTVTLKATLAPNNSTDTITWSSSKKSVAKVTGNGKKAVVTAVKKGTATITAKTSSGKKVTCKVTVKEIPATKIKLNKTSISLKVGKSVTLKATITPKNSTDTIKWSSSKAKVAKVSDKGKVTAVKKGTATITAKTSSGKKVTCKVTVK